MGVKGLLQCLQKATQASSISGFKGTRVAIDASGWLHKGLYAAAEDFVDSGEPAGTEMLSAAVSLPTILLCGLTTPYICSLSHRCLNLIAKTLLLHNQVLMIRNFTSTSYSPEHAACEKQEWSLSWYSTVKETI